MPRTQSARTCGPCLRHRAGVRNICTPCKAFTYKDILFRKTLILLEGLAKWLRPWGGWRVDWWDGGGFFLFRRGGKEKRRIFCFTDRVFLSPPGFFFWEGAVCPSGSRHRRNGFRGEMASGASVARIRRRDAGCAGCFPSCPPAPRTWPTPASPAEPSPRATQYGRGCAGRCFQNHARCRGGC